jgi:glyoxylase-like metal-dependent hydrolase (beta-lactamase superfamily II)
MTEPIQIPLPVAYLGSVNVWLLTGEPLTLVDTGAKTDEDLEALELQLAARGLAIEDVELVLITHHHLDHSGLAATIRERSGARVAAHKKTAEWGVDSAARFAAERRFTEELMREHCVPDDAIARTERFFAEIVDRSSDYETDLVLAHGDEVVAGGRTLTVIFRPGHSTTDTLFIDGAERIAFVGDHLLAQITSGAELVPTELPGEERRRSMLEYLRSLRMTKALDLRALYTGHGPAITDHRRLIDERYAFHRKRLQRIEELVLAGHRTAYDIAGQLWDAETAANQPVLVIWEVVGHLDVLVERGTVKEVVADDGRHVFLPTEVPLVAAER